MKQRQPSASFGKRSEPHTIIIARGNQLRHFTVRPWALALFGSVLSAMLIGYLLATTYLVLRDDLIGASIARQARLQQAYEDRISALRAQVDRITSRQLLDQQVMEKKVSELLERQSQLTRRHGRIGPILERAGDSLGQEVPVPSPRPEIRASLDVGADTAVAYAGAVAPVVPWPIRVSGAPEADISERLLAEIGHSLHSIEQEQLTRLDSLTENTYMATDAITEALSSVGIEVAANYGSENVGGPLLAADQSMLFDRRVRELDEALDKLDALKAEAERLPIRNPAPGAPVSSGFGMRRDPILRRPAFHSGMDFRARSGSSVLATGAGKVVKAGWNGGYGRMVEIDHGNGMTTRYAHLRKTRVKPGDEVVAGTVVGEVGSSGRSTGPHLHYEVRKAAKPVNPISYMKAGRRITKYL